jgi:hypothetical protein
MIRSIALLAVVCLAVTAVCIDQPRAEDIEWSVKADYTDACCCKPSCPCLFGSAPTLGFCEGVSLLEFKEAHYGDVNLDGVNVAAVYRGKTWIKFYVSDSATAEQTEAAVKLLPTFEAFFAIENVVEVKNVTIDIERKEEWRKITMPNTVVEIGVMKGKNGKPIKIENLPWPGFPAPPLNDHTQYKTIMLKHDGGDQKYEHTETNGFTAYVEATSADVH